MSRLHLLLFPLLSFLLDVTLFCVAPCMLSLCLQPALLLLLMGLLRFLSRCLQSLSLLGLLELTNEGRDLLF